MNTQLYRWTPAAILIIAGSQQSIAAGSFDAELEVSSINGANGFVIDGAGRVVSSAGDVNGDGIDDLLIGESTAGPNGPNSGETYIIFGAAGIGAAGVLDASTLNGANGFVCNGINAADSSGYSVSGAGDINGDGTNDIIIGAYRVDQNGDDNGQSYIVFGSPSVGGSGTLELSALNGVNGFVCNGVDAVDFSGYSVSGIGDVNDDGIDDLIIGAIFADPNGQSYAGESYVVFGGAGIGSGGTLELSSLNGANGFVCNGIDAVDRSGVAVSGGGDINGDGIDDLIIGAHYADPNNYSSGETYVVFGNTGLGASGTLDLSALNGVNGFVCNGIELGDTSGRSISNTGDLNGDGVDDIIIGAYAADPNKQNSGESYIVFGGTNVGAGGSLELATLNGANGFVCNGIDRGDFSGRSVSGAGDINGDGFNDFVIGARGADGPFAGYDEDSGEGYVVFGGVGVGASGTMELSSLNGLNGFVVKGESSDDQIGFTVSGAGDINDDGIDDLIIGSPIGESYVIFGRGGCATDLNADNTTDTADLGILISAFGSADPAADINGDGVVDTADLGQLIAAFGETCD